MYFKYFLSGKTIPVFLFFHYFFTFSKRSLKNFRYTVPDKFVESLISFPTLMAIEI